MAYDPDAEKFHFVYGDDAPFRGENTERCVSKDGLRMVWGVVFPPEVRNALGGDKHRTQRRQRQQAANPRLGERVIITPA